MKNLSLKATLAAFLFTIPALAWSGDDILYENFLSNGSNDAYFRLTDVYRKNGNDPGNYTVAEAKAMLNDYAYLKLYQDYYKNKYSQLMESKFADVNTSYEFEDIKNKLATLASGKVYRLSYDVYKLATASLFLNEVTCAYMPKSGKDGDERMPFVSAKDGWVLDLKKNVLVNEYIAKVIPFDRVICPVW